MFCMSILVAMQKARAPKNDWFFADFLFVRERDGFVSHLMYVKLFAIRPSSDGFYIRHIWLRSTVSQRMTELSLGSQILLNYIGVSSLKNVSTWLKWILVIANPLTFLENQSFRLIFMRRVLRTNLRFPSGLLVTGKRIGNIVRTKISADLQESVGPKKTAFG